MQTPSTPNIDIHRASREEAPVLLSLVDALADYERLPRPDAAARQRLVEDCCGAAPRIEAWLAYLDGTPVGYAIVLETYSSFLALPTLYLEDIFVLPEARRKRVGVSLFLAMARLARERGCGRMEWTVLDWNSLALDFYERLGATRMSEWLLHRLTAVDLERLCPP